MTEQNAETPETETTPGEAATADTAEVDWKAKAREWEKRAKDNFAQLNSLKPKAEQFDRLEEASKSEQQRQAEALEAANRERDSYRAEALRFRVAAEHGISKDDLDLLGNGDEEQLASRAARIAELRAAAAAATPKSVPQRPTEQLRPGATPSGQLNEDDALYEQIYGSSTNQ